MGRASGSYRVPRGILVIGLLSPTVSQAGGT